MSRTLVDSGVRYIYTHLPKLLGAGTAAFLKAGAELFYSAA